MRDFRILFTLYPKGPVEVQWEEAESQKEACETFLGRFPFSRHDIRIVNVKVMNETTGNYEHPCPADLCKGTLRQDIDSEWYCQSCDWSTAQLEDGE